MDVLASPIVTIILNLIASVLVSKGILDSHSVVPFVQLGNNLLATIGTTAVGIVTIVKIFELMIHKLNLKHQLAMQQLSQPVTILEPKQSIIQASSQGQSGLPTTVTVNTTDPNTPIV